MSHRGDCPDRWTAERAGRDEARDRPSPDRQKYDCDDAQRD